MDKIISKHFINSSSFTNFEGVGIANFKESLKNVSAVRITSLSVKSFVGINNSLVYYLIIDIATSASNNFSINTKPTNMVFSVTNQALGGNLTKYDSAANFIPVSHQQVYGFGFRLVDQNLNVVNPSDPGWTFCFDLELIHYKDE